jgi:hypothetical protein
LAVDLGQGCRPEPVRLPRAGVPDEELALTGRGPRTELTHEVPGRRPRPEVVVRATPGRRARLSGFREVVSAAGPRAGVVVLVLAVLVTGVWLGTRWGSGPVVTPGPAAATAATATALASPSPSPPAPSAPTDWRAVLDGLYAQRRSAFANGDAAALDAVYTADSPLRVRDESALESLAAAGQVLRGFAPAVVGVTAAHASGDEVRLELTDRWPDYEVVPASRPDGAALRSERGRGAAAVRIVLARTTDGWRIATAERLG